MARKPDEKRESGVNPERSGHCIQGVSFDIIHCTLSYEKEKGICWSVSQETCLVFEERLPMKVQFLTERCFALYLFGVSAFGSRHFLFMECARCGTVQAAGMKSILNMRIYSSVWEAVTAFGLLRRRIYAPHQNPSKADTHYPISASL